MTAGHAFIRIGAVTTGLRAGLAEAQQSLARFSASARAAATPFLGIGAAILSPLTLATRQFSRSGDDIAKASRRTGLATETISALGLAADLAGTSAGEAEAGFRKMQKAIYEAERGEKTALDTLKEFGLTLQELRNLSPEEQFTRFAQVISKTSDPIKRAGLALTLFGRSGTQLIPLMDQLGREGLGELTAQGKALGVVLDRDMAAKAEILNDELSMVQKAVAGISTAIGASLAPAVSTLSKMFQSAASQVVTFVKQNESLVRTLALVGAGALAIGGSLIALSLAAKVGAMALGVLIGIGKVLVAVFSPTVVAIGAVGVAMFAMYEALRSALTGSEDRFVKFFDTIRVGGHSINTWLQTMWINIGTGFQNMIDGIVGTWFKFEHMLTVSKNYIAGMMDALWNGISEGLLNAYYYLQTMLDPDNAQRIQAEKTAAMGTLRDDATEAEKARNAEMRASLKEYNDKQAILDRDRAAREKAALQVIQGIFQKDVGPDPIGDAMDAARQKIEDTGAWYKSEMEKIEQNIQNARDSLPTGDASGKEIQKQLEQAQVKTAEKAIVTFSGRAFTGLSNGMEKRLDKSNDFLRRIEENTRDLETGLA
jgi:TP901 family phage tail tape measure protein